MIKESYSIIAGKALKKILNNNKISQQDFAFDYGCDVRTVSRYINNGITKIQDIEDIAYYFSMDFLDFLKLGISEEKFKDVTDGSIQNQKSINVDTTKRKISGLS